MNFISRTLALLLLCSCSAEHITGGSGSNSSYVPNPNPNPALKAAAADILGPKCTSCHGAGNGVSTVFLNTETDPDLDSLAENQNLVSIGRGSSSYLYLRASDGSMPPGNPLSQAESDAIKSWIDDLGIPASNSGNSSVSFSKIENDILVPKCYSCHSGGSTRPFSNYNDLMYNYVTPNSLDSILYISVTEGATGGLMPEGSSLSPQEIQMIEDWIMSGAPNN